MDYKKHLEKLNGEGKEWDMIVVDAVVGAGKTTLMDILVKERGFLPFEEPVVDNPILDKFYYDRARWSFSLQIFFLNNRFRHVKEASKMENSLLDRSIYGDLIFAKMLADSGEMTPEEYDLYTDLFDNMIEHCKAPKLLIYLEIGVDGAMNRINKRGRDYEQVVEKAYWEKLNSYYRDYFEQYEASPVLRINVDNLDFENNPKDKAYVLDLIDAKLKEIGLNK